MDSSKLKENGFSQPYALKTISFANLPFNNAGVFALIDTSLTGKVASDILYIGRSKKPTRKILGGYLAGYGGKNTKKISLNLLNEGYIERTAITWMSSEKPRMVQEELLAKFVEEHGDVPIWNASKKKQAKIQKVSTKKKVVAPAKKAKPAPKKVKPTAKPRATRSTPKVTPQTTTKPAEPSPETSSESSA